VETAALGCLVEQRSTEILNPHILVAVHSLTGHSGIPLPQFTEADVRRHLDPTRVLAAIESAFRDRYPSVTIPARTHVPLANGIFLAMPCYDPSCHALGTKLVTVRRDPAPGEPSVQATYILLDADTAQPRLIIAANYLTDLRTAATSAIATKYLARQDASTPGIFGTGRLARTHLQLLPQVRNFQRILICGRDPARTSAFVDEIKNDEIKNRNDEVKNRNNDGSKDRGSDEIKNKDRDIINRDRDIDSNVIPTLRKAKGRDLTSANTVTDAAETPPTADTVLRTATIEPADPRTLATESEVLCTCTSNPTPLFEGQDLRPGTHLNLVGSFQPHTREVDTTTVKRSTRILVETYASLSEPGDLLIPMQEGAITRDHIVADLHELITGKKQGRQSKEEITIFKSVGCALEDLVAAELLR
jgi:ornithine cyclodeaminase/alanine dehydrogenase-like protein (mu-crystallin family)